MSGDGTAVNVIANGQDMVDAPTSPSNAPKIQKACDQCRARKVKCDGLPTCTKCATEAQSAHTIMYSSSVRKNTNRKSLLTNLSGNGADRESIHFRRRNRRLQPTPATTPLLLHKLALVLVTALPNYILLLINRSPL
jgi:hypothetical protein